MTPLINALIKAIPNLRAAQWDADLTGFRTADDFITAVLDAQPFVVTDAEADTAALYQMHPPYMASGDGAYLPADRVWIEFAMRDGPGQPVKGHRAFLAWHIADEGALVFDISLHQGAFGIGLAFAIAAETLSPDWDLSDNKVKVALSPSYQHQMTYDRRIGTQPRFFLELLQLLNLPHSLKERTEPPHKGMARLLAAQGGNPAMMKPWRTVSLDRHQPVNDSTDHLTGKPRAYHFVRSFQRVRLGQDERVRAHWRGNTAHGVVHKIYMRGPVRGNQGVRNG